MKRGKWFFVLWLMACVCSLSSCIEEFEADIPEDDSDLLTVEGTICASQENKFILSRTQAVRSTYAPQMVAGAKVSVRGSDGSEHVAQPTDGYYSTWIGVLNPDVEYYLHIETDGEVYESLPQKPLRTEEIAEIIGVQNTPESNIDVLVTPEAPFEPDRANYYTWSYEETWEVHSEYTTTKRYDIDLMGPVIDSDQFPWKGWKDGTSSTIMVGGSPSYEGHHIQRLKLYDIDRGNERMFHRYSGLIHQRAISKAEYEYELARRQAGTEMGGLFTPQPSALPTNIRCLTSSKHVIGFVGCSMNTSEYRFYLNAPDFSIRRPPMEDKRLLLTNPSHKDCVRLLGLGFFLCEWEVSGTTGQIETAWAVESQLDVRYKGAYIERPDFWEDE